MTNIGLETGFLISDHVSVLNPTAVHTFGYYEEKSLKNTDIILCGGRVNFRCRRLLVTLINWKASSEVTNFA